MSELHLTPEILLKMIAESNQRLERMFELSNKEFDKRQKEYEERQKKESENRQREYAKEKEEYKKRQKEEDEKKQKEYEKRQKEYAKEQEEYNKRQKEEDEKRRKEYAKEQEEYNKRQKEQDEKRRKEYAKEQEEYNKRQKEEEEKRRKEYAKEQEEYKKEQQREQKEYEARQKDLDKKLAKITDTLGRFAEDQVRPAALEMFKKIGIPIYEQMLNAIKVGLDGDYLYEVDILLFNTSVVVAVEVKSTLRKEDVDEHIERLKLMQQYPLKGIRGTKIIGAIAAMNAQIDVVKYAIKKGFYVILPDGSSVGLVNKADFKPVHWEIQ